ncbi:MAG: hypothetical protein QXP53_00565 [Candidatus Pacearchaeota archaeon]
MSKKAVVWVSTVLYTLITLALISLVLVAVKPVIDKNRDKVIIEQSTEMLDQIEETFNKASITEGTRLSLRIMIKKGSLLLNSTNDIITWQLQDSSYMYSEPNTVLVKEGGRRIILTEQSKTNPDKWLVSLTFNCSAAGYNITYSGKEQNKTFLPAESSYLFFIENKGNNTLDIYTGNE